MCSLTHGLGESWQTSAANIHGRWGMGVLASEGDLQGTPRTSTTAHISGRGGMGIDPDILNFHLHFIFIAFPLNSLIIPFRV